MVEAPVAPVAPVAPEAGSTPDTVQESHDSGEAIVKDPRGAETAAILEDPERGDVEEKLEGLAGKTIPGDGPAPAGGILDQAAEGVAPSPVSEQAVDVRKSPDNPTDNKDNEEIKKEFSTLYAAADAAVASYRELFEDTPEAVDEPVSSYERSIRLRVAQAIIDTDRTKAEQLASQDSYIQEILDLDRQLQEMQDNPQYKEENGETIPDPSSDPNILAIQRKIAMDPRRLERDMLQGISLDPSGNGKDVRRLLTEIYATHPDPRRRFTDFTRTTAYYDPVAFEYPSNFANGEENNEQEIAVYEEFVTKCPQSAEAYKDLPLVQQAKERIENRKNRTDTPPATAPPAAEAVQQPAEQDAQEAAARAQAAGGVGVTNERPATRADVADMTTVAGTAARTETGAGDAVAQAEAVAAAASEAPALTPEQQAVLNNEAYYNTIVNETADGKPGVPITAKSDVDTVLAVLRAQRGLNLDDPDVMKAARTSVEGAIAHAKKLEGVTDTEEPAAGEQDTTTESQPGMVTAEQVKQIVDAAVDAALTKQAEAYDKKLEGQIEVIDKLQNVIKGLGDKLVESNEIANIEDEKERRKKRNELIKAIGLLLLTIAKDAIVASEPIPDMAGGQQGH